MTDRASRESTTAPDPAQTAERTLRDRTIFGSYRVDVREEAPGQYRIEVYLRDRLIGGVRPNGDLEEAVVVGRAFAEQLRGRMTAGGTRRGDGRE